MLDLIKGLLKWLAQTFVGIFVFLLILDFIIVPVVQKRGVGEIETHAKAVGDNLLAAVKNTGAVFGDIGKAISGDGSSASAKSATVTATGSTPSNSSSTTSTNSVDQIDTAIASYQPGWSWSYSGKAEQLAKRAGADVVWYDDYVNVLCLGDFDSATIAFYCPDDVNTVYANKAWIGYDQMIHDVHYLDYIRHELAHRSIYLRCQATDPPVVQRLATNSEAVANAYAVHYLAADSEVLSGLGSGTSSEYQITDAAYQAADSIRSGACS